MKTVSGSAVLAGLKVSAHFSLHSQPCQGSRENRGLMSCLKRQTGSSWAASKRYQMDTVKHARNKDIRRCPVVRSTLRQSAVAPAEAANNISLEGRLKVIGESSSQTGQQTADDRFSCF